MSKLSAEQTAQLQAAFQLMDVNGDGFVTRDELKALLQGLGEEVSEEMIDEMMAMADENGDAKITFAEFVSAATAAVALAEAEAEAEVHAEVETHAEVEVWGTSWDEPVSRKDLYFECF